MKAVDIVLVIILLAGAYKGFKNGFLLEVASFFCFIIAIISAFKLLHTGIVWLSPHMEKGSRLVPYIAFIIIFLAVFVGIFLFVRVLKRIIDFSVFGTADNFIGALFGMLEIAFVISLILWLTQQAGIRFPKDFISGAVIYPKLVPFAAQVVGWVSYVVPFQNIFPSIKEALKG